MSFGTALMGSLPVLSGMNALGHLLLQGMPSESAVYTGVKDRMAPRGSLVR